MQLPLFLGEEDLVGAMAGGPMDALPGDGTTPLHGAHLRVREISPVLVRPGTIADVLDLPFEPRYEQRWFGSVVEEGRP